MLKQRVKLLVILILACLPLVTNAAKGGKDGEREDESRITALEKQVAELRVLLAGISRSTDSNTGQDTMTFSGMNVQIVNGLGATSETDGTGNLIVGYNELREAGDNFRGGSHMLVIGAFNNYTNLSYGGMSVGRQNEAAAPFASVSGGSHNLASGWGASISGGMSNLASGFAASVNGGMSNLAGGEFATVGGGKVNVADGEFSAVSGGRTNMAGTKYASVSGGVNNSAMGWGSSVSGGHLNEANWYYASISGGNENLANGYATAVSGGEAKNAESAYCWEAADQADC